MLHVTEKPEYTHEIRYVKFRDMWKIDLSDEHAYLKDVQVLEHVYRGINATRREIGLFFPY